MSSHAARLEPSRLRLRGRSIALPQAAPDAILSVALGLILAAIALRGGGGTQLGPATTVEISLELGGGLIAAVALLAADRTRVHGAFALALMAALAGLTALSVLWSVNPSDTWLEADRTLSYAIVFAAGIALVRLAGARWPAIVGATVIAAVIVCGYAVLTKIFPASLNPDEVYARLREPFGYWNAVGLMAALGTPGCLWLGARRTGHAALNALAYPALGLFVVCVLLAYSRGALLAMIVGCGFWFAVVPLRLRAAAVLIVGALGGLLVALWAFSQSELTNDRVDLALRTGAGHELGVLVIAMLLLLLVAGLAIGFLTARRAPGLGVRLQAGTALIVTLSLVPVALLGVLAFSERGLGGSVSKGWRSLTDPKASTPANDPGRLTAVGSVRARYWNEALKIFKAEKLLGVGAGGYATARPRYRDDDLDVRHAHGYVVQTLSDLGAVGMALSLALLAAWLAATWRSVGGRRPWAIGPAALAPGQDRRRPVSSPWNPERVGLVTLVAVVVVFGVHSFVDWTWFIPGNAVLALLCAAWVAGRGPVEEPAPSAGGLWQRAAAGARDRWRAGAAGVAVLVALAAAWATWQPLRSQNTSDAALGAVEANNIPKARSEARHAADINPLSVEPLFDLAVIETHAGRKVAARSALEEAVRVQPSNPRTWLRLAGFDLDVLNNPREAISALGPALYLDPRSTEGIGMYLRASRDAPTTDAAPVSGSLPKESTRPGAASPAGATTTPKSGG